MEATMPIAARVVGLFVYPVKGAAGIAVDGWPLTARGLEHDRRWMIVDAGGRYLSQRVLPRLVRLRPELGGDGLHLTADGERLAVVPLADSGEPCEVEVWGDRVAALAPDPAADRVLSAWIGRAVRLVRFPEDARRACDPRFAPPGSHTGFADGFPLLVTSEASLDELNAALAEPVPMDRFRPNLVIGRAPPGAEDRAGALALADGSRLLLVKPCARCVVTTVDQATGSTTGKEPLATLVRLRRNPRKAGAFFGQNAVPEPASGARLQVGAACRLVAA